MVYLRIDAGLVLRVFMTDPKSALITGASEGIGRAFATRLAADGYTVTAVGRNKSRLRSLMDHLPGRGHCYRVADLGAPNGLNDIVATINETPYKLLVNNAGITHYGHFAKLPWPKQHEILRLNCEALTLLAHAFLSRATSGDALVNVSSTLAFLPQPTSALYSASKAFVTALSEALWFENRPLGVYVVGIHPGITHTEFRRRGGGKPTRAPWAQDADEVVDAGMRALAQRKSCTVISGRFNRGLAALSRLLPRQSLVALLGRSRSRPAGQDSSI